MKRFIPIITTIKRKTLKSLGKAIYFLDHYTLTGMRHILSPSSAHSTPKGCMITYRCDFCEKSIQRFVKNGDPIKEAFSTKRIEKKDEK